MSCTICGHLYCICPSVKGTNAIEQRLLHMWQVFIDGHVHCGVEHEDRDDEPDPTPRILLDWFRQDRRVPFSVLEEMAKIAREYGYEV